MPATELRSIVCATRQTYGGTRLAPHYLGYTDPWELRTGNPDFWAWTQYRDRAELFEPLEARRLAETAIEYWNERLRAGQGGRVQCSAELHVDPAPTARALCAPPTPSQAELPLSPHGTVPVIDMFYAEHFRCDNCHALDCSDNQSPELGTCETCFSRNYFTCYHCEEHHRVEYEHEIDGESYCQECRRELAYCCVGCGTCHLEDGDDDPAFRTDDGDGPYCEYCYNRRNRACSDCGNRMRSADSCDSHQCRTCRERNQPIKGACAKAPDYLGMLGDPKDGLRLGVELEVELSNTEADAEDYATRVVQAIGSDFVICKHDGSLSNGFEIVSAPADLDTHRERWTKLLTDRTAIKGLRSHRTESCGLHVHITRAKVTPLTVGKMLVFLNASANSSFLTALAGRGPNQYCNRKPKRISDAKDQANSRYEALNTLNRATLEYRIFKGTLTVSGVMRAVEFARALVYFCRDASCQKLGYLDFGVWMRGHRKEYPALAAFMVKVNLLPAPKARRPQAVKVS